MSEVKEKTPFKIKGMLESIQGSPASHLRADVKKYFFIKNNAKFSMEVLRTEYVPEAGPWIDFKNPDMGRKGFLKIDVRVTDEDGRWADGSGSGNLFDKKEVEKAVTAAKQSAISDLGYDTLFGEDVNVEGLVQELIRFAAEQAKKNSGNSYQKGGSTGSTSNIGGNTGGATPYISEKQLNWMKRELEKTGRTIESKDFKDYLKEINVEIPEKIEKGVFNEIMAVVQNLAAE